MKITKVLLWSIALCTGLSAYSQDNITVVLKDGTELTGYVSRQRPGENFTFTTSKATVLLPSQEVQSIIDTEVNESSLNQEWLDWAEKNEAFDGTGPTRTLHLSDIITKTGSISRVRVLEKGAKVKYLELTPNAYSLNWDTIQMLKADKRPKLMLSGVNRRYKLANGMEYEGQYVEEVPGQTVSLLGNNGIVEVIRTDDVMKDNRIKINPNQTLVEQSDLLDIVQLKKGGPYRGVIFERNYFDPKSSIKDYLLIQLENGATISVNMDDVEEYRKERNPQYNPLTDIALEEGQAAINRHTAMWVPTKENQGVIVVENLDSLQKKMPIISAQDIKAEVKLDNVKAQQLKLLKIRKYQDKKTKTSYYGFTYEDMVKNAVLPLSVATSVNGISKLEYTIPLGAPGIYGLYDPLANKILLFTITQPKTVG